MIRAPMALANHGNATGTDRFNWGIVNQEVLRQPYFREDVANAQSNKALLEATL
jgi:hypothetical protein